MTTKALVIGVVALTLTGVSLALARPLAYHVLPVGWTGEPERLAARLAITSGKHVAEIGAGNGALAAEVARMVGEGGRLYVTELSDARRGEIEARVHTRGLAHVSVLAASSDRTNLPDTCCDALYMRMVFHHIESPVEYAREVARAVRPGGRVAIIDFAPGSLFFLGPHHGVAPETVVDAFEGAGFQLIERVERWGGGTYLLLFSNQALPARKTLTAARLESGAAVRDHRIH
jgi:ubiquinone/menaquinone biosynthesis C-methylase UbiE